MKIKSFRRAPKPKVPPSSTHIVLGVDFHDALLYMGLEGWETQLERARIWAEIDAIKFVKQHNSANRLRDAEDRITATLRKAR